MKTIDVVVPKIVSIVAIVVIVHPVPEMRASVNAVVVDLNAEVNVAVRWEKGVNVVANQPNVASVSSVVSV